MVSVASVGRVSAWTYVRWNGYRVASSVAPDGKTVTATVLPSASASAGTATLDLFDPQTGTQSPAVQIRIE